MDDKIKVVIGFVLIVLAIVSYLFSQLSSSLESLGTNLLLIFLALVFALAGLFLLWRYLPKVL
ncbi:MAG: hypothetical protein ACP5C3_00950 [Methanomicrobiales archaeon]